MADQVSTIPAVLQRAAARSPQRPALVEPDRELLSFSDLWAAVAPVAEAVASAGVGPGERVALWAPNSIDWVLAAMGTLVAGATLVPLNTRSTSAEVAAVLRQAGCRLAFGQAAFLGRSLAGELLQAVPGLPVVTLGEGSAAGARSWASFLAAPAPAQAEAAARRLAGITGDSIAYIQFTSGTTGTPKGAMLRHGALVRTTAAWVDAVGLRAGDVYPVVSPFSHIAGHKTGLLAAAVAEAQVLPVAVYQAQALADIIGRHQVSFLQGPPTMFQELVGLVGTGADVPGALRVAVTGAAAIPPALIRDMHQVLGLEQVFTAYGLTEASGVCTITGPHDPIELVATTSGRPLAGIEVATAGSDGRLLGRGERGEILVRGFHLMAGYLDDADATAAAIRDGWLHTGDVGWVGDDGCLRIVDRLTDMVIVGGNNAYPAEIEQVLLEHPDVDRVAVVGVPDERLGEVTAAFVQRRGVEMTVEDLQEFGRQRLARFKVPRYVWFVDELPLNATGKVLKGELRRRGRQLAG